MHFLVPPGSACRSTFALVKVKSRESVWFSSYVSFCNELHNIIILKL